MSSSRVKGGGIEERIFERGRARWEKHTRDNLTLQAVETRLVFSQTVLRYVHVHHTVLMAGADLGQAGQSRNRRLHKHTHSHARVLCRLPWVPSRIVRIGILLHAASSSSSRLNSSNLFTLHELSLSPFADAVNGA